MATLSNKAMLEMLKKVQPVQIQLLEKNVDAHLDAGVYGLRRGEPYIAFDVTVFVETDLVEQFEFDAHDTQEQLDATLVSLQAYANSL